MRQRNRSNAEKLDAILHKLDGIENKVDAQNEELAQLRQEMRRLKLQVNEMSKKNRAQSLVAGGVGGGLVYVGIELIKWKLGG